MTNILRTIGELFLTLSVGVASLFGFSAPAPEPNVGATIPIPVAVFQTSLQSSITSSATSMTLVTGTDKSGDALSGYVCFNIDEGTSLEEFVCGTATGTSIASMLRGIDPIDGDLEVTALKKAHKRGASVKVTNYPTLGILARILNGDETIPNKLTYASAPTFSAGNELITKTYADALTFAGAPDASTIAKGLAEEATAAEINAATAAGGTSARLFINPSTLATSNYGTFLPSTGQKDALVGTAGTPGSSNKYVTNDDTSATASGSLIPRGSGGKIATGWIDTGTSASDIVQLDGSAKLPAVSGSALTSVVHGISTGQATYNSTGAKTIAHGLGVTPIYVQINTTWAYQFGGGYGMVATSFGTATTISNETCSYADTISTTTANVSGQNNAAIVCGTYTTATLTGLDATNITIDFTTFTQGTSYIQWTAYY